MNISAEKIILARVVVINFTNEISWNMKIFRCMGVGRNRIKSRASVYGDTEIKPKMQLISLSHFLSAEWLWRKKTNIAVPVVLRILTISCNCDRSWDFDTLKFMHMF